jgi:aquaporin NIP
MKKYLAELIGTFGLVFCGTGAIIINEVSGGSISHVGIAITFGLVVVAMIYTFGDISGSHINPAVTIAFAVIQKIEVVEAIKYIISQVIGALLASFVLHFLFPENQNLGATLPVGSEMQSFILEFILTFFLMLVVIHTSQGKKEVQNIAGIVIGGTVLLEAMFAGPICGASMNPARSLSPALISGNLQSTWIYIVAPILGAILAVLTWRKIFS